VKVRWTAQAEQDRVDIMGHIAADNVRAAIAIDELFGATAARLADFPLLGKPGQIAGTREWVAHESYRMIYEVDEAEQTVWVLALVHTARQWPPPRRA
jgi:addiction module RelE/StbE family toxin